MSFTLNRLADSVGASPVVYARIAHKPANAGRTIWAMLDRGVADDHAAAIARAGARGQSGCKFCR